MELREQAAEDAADSTIIAASAAGWQAVGHRVLNYEGPFGVGYGVAILFAEEPEPDAATISPHREGDVLPAIAQRSIKADVLGGSGTSPHAEGDY